MDPLFHSIEEAISDLARGKMIIVVDDENRENEGDFVMAAEKVRPEDINFMARYGRGMICVPLEETRARFLNFIPMVPHNTSSHQTAFTVTIDAKEGISTGISAADRATTIRKITDPMSSPESFVRPGHLFPLIAKSGGVLVRPGHTEASVDLARLAGLNPSGVICEILNDDGTMARVPQLKELAERFHLKMVTIADLIAYRQTHEISMILKESIPLPTKHGDFTLSYFENRYTQEFHLLLAQGELKPNSLVRVHSQCQTGDLFGSKRCDCQSQLEKGLEMISKEGSGALLYMHQEGRGIGLLNKLKAYKLQDEGLDTVEANQQLGFPADARDYALASQMLKAVGLREVRLLTNNPDKVKSLQRYGLKVTRVPFPSQPHHENVKYMMTKKTKLGHDLPLLGDKA